MRYAFAILGAALLLVEALSLTGLTRIEAAAETRKFTLYVREGWVRMPDGAQVYAWGFTDEPNGPPRIPGPAIVVEEGDEVEITLVNDRDPTVSSLQPDGEGHTIHLHGLDVGTEHDGVPETFAPGLVRQGQSYTYRFTAQHAGTYFYHCHQNNVEHQQMGMYGSIVVRAKGGANTAYTNGPPFDREQTFVLAEFGSQGHEQARKAVQEGGLPYNWLDYRPDYFLVNEQFSADPEQVATTVDARPGERLLLRLVNAGYIAHEVHTHGQQFTVVATDGRPWPAGPTTDTLWLGPGEKYDVLVSGSAAGSFVLHDHVTGLYGGQQQPSAAAAVAPTGVTRQVTLYVREGTQQMPDNTSLYVYGFTDDPSGAARVPGPTIAADEGDQFEVTLVNDRDPTGTGHGLQVPGLGLPIDGPSVVPPGGQGTYRFIAGRTGSYYYADTVGTNQQMGMYGALVVRPPDAPTTVRRDGPAFTQEYTLLLSEMDSHSQDLVHQASLEGVEPARITFTPNYFLMNGLSYPDTEANSASMVHANPGDVVLLRLINAGQRAHAMHLHGYHFLLVDRNGYPIDQGPLKDTVLIAPGESYDVIFLADQSGMYPLHDHFETSNTNNGVWLGGMHTMVATGVAHEMSTPSPTATLPAGEVIAVRDNFYTPSRLTVALGTTVTWVNEGRTEHTATSLSGYFDSGTMRNGDTFSYTFTQPGRYDFFCRFHLTNRGSITVG